MPPVQVNPANLRAYQNDDGSITYAGVVEAGGAQVGAANPLPVSAGPTDFAKRLPVSSDWVNKQTLIYLRAIATMLHEAFGLQGEPEDYVREATLLDSDIN